MSSNELELPPIPPLPKLLAPLFQATTLSPCRHYYAPQGKDIPRFSLSLPKEVIAVHKVLTMS